MTLKQGSTLFLKIVISLIGIVTLAGLIWFPQTEGRAANLDLFSIYRDPLIIYGFIASIPFFVALYHGFKLLSYVDQNKVFSESAVKAVRNIKYCAITLSGFIVLGMLYIRLFAHGEDAAGPTAVGIFTTFAAIVIATAAAVFERLLQNAVDLKSENDLTVWDAIMAIIINIDVMLAKRKMRVTELSEKVGITMANLSILKNGKAKAIRLSTLEAICKALDCQPGDILEYKGD
jgi:DNA-binding Xre family transcriptional regulator